MIAFVLKFTASLAWSSLNVVMRLLFQKGWLKTEKIPAYVISVGNLQAGGAGKTPLVIQVAREAIQRGRTVCILSRGYGKEGSGGIISPGSSHADPREFGDEPSLIHQQVPQAWIGVSSDRIRAYREIERQLGHAPDLVILDDGFQHWKIARDRDVLAVTSTRWGQGIFRDFYAASKKADLVVWSKGWVRPDWVASHSWTKIEYQVPRCMDSQRRFWLISGVADPKNVLHSVQDAGYAVVRHFAFPDHAQYSKSEAEKLILQAEQAGTTLLMTGKDAVKWKALGFNEKNWVSLEPQVVFREGTEAWRRTLWGD